MRIPLANNNIEDDIAELEQFIEEWKTPQFTSQDSGMLARIARAATRNQYGDIVEVSGDIPGTFTSQIQLPATPNTFSYNSIYAVQIFIPKQNKPVVAIPLLKLKVDSNGLHGESELFVSAQWGITMPIYNAQNQKVGDMAVNQSLGGLFEPIYHPDYEYVWETNISYTSTVPFTLSYEFTVRSSHDGNTYSELEGLFF